MYSRQSRPPGRLSVLASDFGMRAEEFNPGITPLWLHEMTAGFSGEYLHRLARSVAGGELIDPVSDTAELGRSGCVRSSFHKAPRYACSRSKWWGDSTRSNLVNELDGAPAPQPIVHVRRSQRSNAEMWTSLRHRQPPTCSRPMPTSPSVPRRRSGTVPAFREWLRAGAPACGERPPRRQVAEIVGWSGSVPQ